jgi:hypothetical protein
VTKGKGSSFERRICKTLSLWWTDGQRDDVFWRSSNSGGRATIRSRKSKGTFGQYGDVQATDPIGQPLIDLCTIELKRGYSDSTIGDALDCSIKAKAQTWELFVRQAIAQQDEAGSLYWLLITQRDRRDAIIYMPAELVVALSSLGSGLSMVRPAVRFKPNCRLPNSSVFGTKLEEFLSVVDPMHIRHAKSIKAKR